MLAAQRPLVPMLAGSIAGLVGRWLLLLVDIFFLKDHSIQCGRAVTMC